MSASLLTPELLLSCAALSGVADCSEACALHPDAPVAVAAGKALYSVTMPRGSFQLEFQVRAVTLASAGQARSILALLDHSEPDNVLEVLVSDTRALLLTYQDMAVVVEGGPMLVAGYSAVWTTVTIVYESASVDRSTAGLVTFKTSAGDNGMAAVAPLTISEFESVTIFASRSGASSSNGAVRDIRITGAATID